MVLFFISHPFSLFSKTIENCKKCDGEILSTIQSNLGKLKKNHINVFFCTLDISCSNNAEFSEFSTELLIHVLNEMPEFTVVAISKLNSNKKAYILSKLSSPPESCDINKLIDKLSSVKKKKLTRDEVIGILMLANNKC